MNDAGGELLSALEEIVLTTRERGGKHTEFRKLPLGRSV
jgi:hypothetical protein